ncbi:MAG: MBL fold metallo-hydrolase [Solobacterium sp.]|nr:MBL fold metallo-hydrolase [Solobacterium sp.]
MKLVLLGTGTPNAEPWAGFPASAVITGGKVFLFDCGPGVVRACTAMYYKGIGELKPQNLQRVFLTHLHSDHSAGLAEVILMPWVLERTEPLHVYGPQGCEEMASCLLAAYRIDTDFRSDGPEPINHTGHTVVPHIIQEGIVFDEDGVTVSALKVRHGTLDAFAFRIEAEGRSIVISGDTAPLEAMKEFAKDADLLLHEAEYTAALKERTEAWQNYHRGVHTMSCDLADIISAARPKLTVTTHRILHLNYYGDSPVSLSTVRERENALLQEITSRTDLPVVNGRDQDVFTV